MAQILWLPWRSGCDITEERVLAAEIMMKSWKSILTFHILYRICPIDFLMCMRSKLMSSAMDIVQLFLCNKLVTSRNEHGHWSHVIQRANGEVELHR
jgi:hypothetical protein